MNLLSKITTCATKNKSEYMVYKEKKERESSISKIRELEQFQVLLDLLGKCVIKYTYWN